MSKAHLYLRSNPHRHPGNLRKYGFEVYLGSPERLRIRLVTATSITKALNIARTLCRSREQVMEVHLDGVKIWDAIERITP